MIKKIKKFWKRWRKATKKTRPNSPLADLLIAQQENINELYTIINAFACRLGYDINNSSGVIEIKKVKKVK